MKNIFKLLSFAIFFFAFTLRAEAQVKPNKTEKKEIKKHHLSKRDKEVRRTFRKSLKREKESIKKNSALTDEQKKAQLEQLEKEKHNKLQVILSPEQKEIMKEKKENTPRRGVTNMPNERTAK